MIFDPIKNRYVYNIKKIIREGSETSTKNTPIENTTEEKIIESMEYKKKLDQCFFLINKQDNTGMVFSNDGAFDFLNPWSLEFKGIYELYHFIMLQLLLIFLILIFIVLFGIFKVTSSLIENKAEVVNVCYKNWDFRIINSIIEWYIQQHIYASHVWMQWEWSYSIVINWAPFLWANSLFNKRIRNGLSIYRVYTSASFWSNYSTLEFIWTAIPCIILLFISIPSFTLALALDEIHKPVIWIKVIANQWYWMYEYSTFDDNITIYSNVVYGVDLNQNTLRLLQPDLTVTLLCNKFTRLLITSTDVIHSWAIPALGIKIDACPGRINAISVLPSKRGVYYGQCSEICGVNHGFMPICVEVI